MDILSEAVVKTLDDVELRRRDNTPAGGSMVRVSCGRKRAYVNIGEDFRTFALRIPEWLQPKNLQFAFGQTITPPKY